MYDRRHVSIRSAARWVAVMPVLLIGSMLFWTLALGLGGVSLLAVTGLSTVDSADAPMDLAPTATEPVTGHENSPIDSPISGPITVHIEESTEPEDVNDNAGAAVVGPAADDTDRHGL